jgi:hypothetical protein
MEPNFSEMKTRLLSIVVSICFSVTQLSAQNDGERMYKINWKYDAPITLIGGGLTALGFKQISEQDGVDSATLVNLDKNDINGFDRFAADNYSLDAEKASDYLFFGAFPYGLILLADKEARAEAGTIGLLYLQALSLSSAGYAMAAGNTSRYRPYTYIQDQPNNQDLQDDRKSLHTRNSFYGGHPATVAVSTVFVAKVYSDLNPDSGLKYAFWGIAAGASLGCAYLRLEAGKHFPTDLITGLAISSAVGYLVPHLHKTNRGKETSSLQIMPFTGNAHGMQLTYTFKDKNRTIKDFNL